MTLDQQIQIWNVVGTWLAGIATFLAVAVSLFLVRRNEAVRLHVDVGIRLLVEGNGTPPLDIVAFQVTNIGDRTINVVSVGWRVGTGKSMRFCLQMIGPQSPSTYPKQIAHGEQAMFLVPLDESSVWLDSFAVDFVKGTQIVPTLTAQIHTSLGKTINVKPEPSLLEKVSAAIEASKLNAPK